MTVSAGADPAAPRKRSVMIAGHATSVSMEQAFWDLLATFAEARGVSLNALVTEIDRTRTANLSSAIRVWVLRECARLAGLEDGPAG
ncbi:MULTISPECIES: ribbon-helix-helix domain-containing protein [Thalassobaculum]|uniref:Ribbon-helix-helix domain-containing protein n=1 Tax=Thalassobaculum litoreum DSM 18839 TaxID=1123362 RepID=A0A8G2F431_9PROT|nr:MULTISPECIES: ribbon-helix-helix domain-containing protein [Thalassobaculum]SDG04912.1 Ribbon-helix-helix domain-containing protein [Thalassobaculum litoreum DSM 18839]